MLVETDAAHDLIRISPQAIVHLHQVVAAAERAPGSAKDHHVQVLFGLHLLDGRHDLVGQLYSQRIQPLRRIPDDVGDPAFVSVIDLHLLVALMALGCKSGDGLTFAHDNCSPHGQNELERKKRCVLGGLLRPLQAARDSLVRSGDRDLHC